MSTHAEKCQTFRQMHERPGLFVMPNPWDVGSARMLEGLGFEAVATTSSGFAFAQGRRDYQMGRDAVLEHCRTLVAATSVPLSADLENGFGDDPQTVAETIRLAAETGLAGGSIEDSIGPPVSGIYEHALAVERIRAAAEAARQLPCPFVLTARCENYLHQRADLSDTIRRLQAYQDAGADVLYAPAIKNPDDVATLVRSVDRPVNVLMGMPAMNLSVAQLAAIGVKRITVGSALARAAIGGFLRAAREIRENGTFHFNDEAASSMEINSLLDRSP
ncbi:MAG TPA: isocitrate lyase/phosphoenolpyruvate mutase family protein [Planctomycetaceae bacterium]|nr:isocitrate lyase/phosphoenolpyruvate mutase family protein [Planctomycetaceae bacterium]